MMEDQSEGGREERRFSEGKREEGREGRETERQEMRKSSLGL